MPSINLEEIGRKVAAGMLLSVEEIEALRGAQQKEDLLAALSQRRSAERKTGNVLDRTPFCVESIYSTAAAGSAPRLQPLLAPERLDVDTADELDATGGDMHTQDGIGWAALHRACREGHLECAQQLLHAGAAVDQLDDQGWAPLHHACSKVRPACARLLLDYGAAVDVANRRGNTPFHLACLGGPWNPDAVALQDLLAQRGAKRERPTWLTPTESVKKETKA